MNNILETRAEFYLAKMKVPQYEHRWRGGHCAADRVTVCWSLDFSWIFLYKHIYIHTNIHTHIYTYIHTHTHTHIIDHMST